MTRKEALDAAAQCVLQDRNGSYGEPENSFADIAALWSVILRSEVKTWEVALCLDAVKTARLMVNPTHADSWVDKCGYSACGAEVATK